jgi:hypothetical protein
VRQSKGKEHQGRREVNSTMQYFLTPHSQTVVAAHGSIEYAP